ncbi:hypothetical protein DLM78_11320 [Leptospira stimsonii]|uniref:Uncharacterized protein n=1 Tax=Leptospira stimsonii TaxID=2202203 RepID=A0A8B3CR17_9LEPT|nr:hypothetical protein DLM78_11320 [Leptospira stimsonii]
MFSESYLSISGSRFFLGNGTNEWQPFREIVAIHSNYFQERRRTSLGSAASVGIALFLAPAA